MVNFIINFIIIIGFSLIICYVWMYFFPTSPFTRFINKLLSLEYRQALEQEKTLEKVLKIQVPGDPLATIQSQIAEIIQLGDREALKELIEMHAMALQALQGMISATKFKGEYERVPIEEKTKKIIAEIDLKKSQAELGKIDKGPQEATQKQAPPLLLDHIKTFLTKEIRLQNELQKLREEYAYLSDVQFQEKVEEARHDYKMTINKK